MLVKFEIGVGIQFDRYSRPLASQYVESAIAQMQLEACKLFGGITLHRVTGGWVSPEDKLVQEDGIVFVILTDESRGSEVREFANKVGRALNQSAAVFTFVRVEGEIFNVEY